MRKLVILLVLGLIGSTLLFRMRPWGPASSPTSATWPLREGQSDRLALLIGVEDYPGDGDDLRGCRRDVQEARALITSRFGFAQEDVRVLLDEQATLAGVLRGFEELLARARPGAEVLVWYSGHGSTVPDVNGDEGDRRDETWVLWDSRLGGRRGSWDLPDDGVSALLFALQQRTPNLTLVTDACHSGDLRKRNWGPPLRARRIVAGERSISLERLGQVWPAGVPLDLELDYDRGGYVHLAACAPWQKATELDLTQPDGTAGAMGNLSFHLLDALRRCPPGITWERVAHEVRLGVTSENPAQQPWFDGAGERSVFGAEFEPVPASARASWLKDRVRISAGGLHGFDVGCRVEVRANLTNDRLGLAEVQVAGELESWARFVGAAPDLADGAALRARVIARGPDQRPLRLALMGTLTEDELPPEGLVADVAPGEQPDLVFTADRRLVTPEGLQLFPNAAGETLARSIEREWEFQRVLALHRQPGSLRTSASFELPTPEELKAYSAAASDLEQVHGAWRATGGWSDGAQPDEPDEFRLGALVVRSLEERDVYLTVLAVSEDRSVVELYPERQVHPSQALLRKGSTVRVPVGFALPTSWKLERDLVDRYLVITTRRPVDFSFIERGPVMRGGEAAGADGSADAPALFRRAFVPFRGEGLTPVEDPDAYGLTTLEVYVRAE